MSRHLNSAPLPSPGSSVLPAICRGTLIAFGISLTLLFIAALVLYFTAVPEKYSPYMVFVISVVAILWGSGTAGKRIGYRGWLYGGIVGFLYVFLMMVTGILVLDDFVLGMNIFTKLFLGFAFGFVGGILGVNR